MPSMPGIMTSTIAASNGTVRASSRPSAPLAADRTEYPSRESSVSRISRMISSSSTMRIEPWRGMTAIYLLCGTSQGLSGGKREAQREPRALPHRAVAVDRAIVLAHDAVGDRQAEPGALANRLSREERIVDAREVFAGDARPGVGDFDDGLFVLHAR